MKKRMLFIAAVLLVLSMLQLVNLSSYGSPRLARTTDSAIAAGKLSGLEIGKAIPVDMVAESAGLDGLTGRELRDQKLDWLLFSAVIALGKSSEELNQILYDLPTLRQGYMRPVGNFEFGTTRSRYVGNDTVLALVPAKVSLAQRKDDLAAIADLQRKNLGSIAFKQLAVVEYAVDDSRAVLTRREDIPASRLFSPEFGYVEQQVATAAQLSAFMKSADGLTAVTVQPSGLLLGGRKLQAAPYRPITMDLVATVWQAERALQKQAREWEAFVKAEETKFNAQWARVGRGPGYDAALEAVKARVAVEQEKRGTGSGTGFSLDPDIDLQALRADFDQMAPLLKESGGGDAMSDISRRLGEGDIIPYLRLTQAAEQQRSFMSRILRRLQEKHSFQKARYDGDLQGTEVGMVLFYTDLLAKLWVIDFASSSPSHKEISGFVDGPGLRMSAAYEAESNELSHARLWFGHSNQGVQFADNGQSVLFAHNATRIFSAGSNELKPGVEVQASALLAAPIDWWNDHYEEVARLEPEYQRLNEIMKWSVVVAWLSGKEQAQMLEFLAPIKVDRSLVFPTWVADKPELKFSNWGSVGFHAAGYKGSHTESLPLLTGRRGETGTTLSGGVSLASKEVAKRAGVTNEIPGIIRRSALDYGRTPGGSALHTLDDLTFTFKAVNAETHAVTASAKDGTKLRGASAQLRPADFERVTRGHSGAVTMDTRSGGTSIGELSIDRSGNGFTVGWKGRELAQAHALANELSVRGLGRAFLHADPRIERIVELGPAEYAVQLKGSRSWIRIAAEKEPRVDIDPAWQLRAADTKEVSPRAMQAAVIDQKTLGDAIPADRHFVVTTGPGNKVVLKLANDEVPSTGLVQLESGAGSNMQAWVDAGGGIHVRGGDRAATFTEALRLHADDIAAIRLAAKDGRNVRVGGTDDLIASIEKGDFRTAARKIADDPSAAKAIWDRELAQDLARNAQMRSRLGTAESLHNIDALIALHGARPELLLRRGLLKIQRGNLDAAVADMQAAPRRKLADRTSFFDEVNAMQRNANGAQDNMRRYAQLVDHRDAEVLNLQTTYRAEARFDGARLDIDMTLLAMPGNEAVIARAADLAPVAVYRQKGVASLDTVNWNAPMDEALTQVIMGGLGKVVRVPKGRVADYRPAAVWSPDHTREFVAVRRGEIPPTNVGVPIARVGTQACNGNAEPGTSCLWQREEPRRRQDDVYIVVAN